MHAHMGPARSQERCSQHRQPGRSRARWEIGPLTLGRRSTCRQSDRAWVWAACARELLPVPLINPVQHERSWRVHGEAAARPPWGRRSVCRQTLSALGMGAVRTRACCHRRSQRSLSRFQRVISSTLPRRSSGAPPACKNPSKHIQLCTERSRSRGACGQGTLHRRNAALHVRAKRAVQRRRLASALAGRCQMEVTRTPTT